MTNARYLSRDEARRLAERVLSFSRADEARVNISSGSEGNTRFAVSQISTAGDSANLSVVVTSAIGKRVASASTNRLDDQSLQRVVETSERLARLVPDDPEYMGQLGQQEYTDVDAVFPATANLTPAERASAVEEVNGPARQRSLLATGFLVHGTGASAVATTRGLFAYNAQSRANFTTTVRTPDGTGSGWAGVGANDWADVNTRQLGARAIEKAEQSREPVAVEPGRWTVVLEPTAVANMVGLMMGFGALSGRSADEGRSFFSQRGGGNKIGQKVVDERVTIHSDPGDRSLLSAPFTGEGLPNKRTVWFENGVVRNLVYDRYWASRQNREPSGFPSGWMMEGGSASVDDMIRSTPRGLLVTRFWYIRGVDPRTILFTGLTRDGTFLIENGRVTRPVKNLRWNESPVFMLNNLEMMGQTVRVSPSEASGLAPTVMVPPLKVRDFTFTSLSDAV